MPARSKRTRVKKPTIPATARAAMAATLKSAMTAIVQVERDQEYPFDVEPKTKLAIMKAHSALCEAWLQVENSGT